MSSDMPGIRERLDNHSSAEMVWLCMCTSLTTIGDFLTYKDDEKNLILERCIGEVLLHALELGRRLEYMQALSVRKEQLEFLEQMVDHGRPV